MKKRHKAQIHPSSSTSSSSASLLPIISNSNNDALALAHSVLKLLPAAILTIALVLPLQDREVLAYMITRSINTITTIPSAFTQENTARKSGTIHKPPLFDCDCFDCYISYWFRWDSSPNRELIHHAIEAFEEGLINTNGEQQSRKKKERKGRAGLEKMLLSSEEKAGNQSPPEIQEWGLTAQDMPEDEVSVLESANLVYGSGDCNELPESLSLDKEAEAEAQLPEAAVVWRVGGVSTHKGLARKVLPDVLGLLNWRFWSLWNLNV